MDQESSSDVGRQYSQILQMLKGNESAPTVNTVKLDTADTSSSVAGTITALLSNLVESNWIVDTEASNHMVHNKEFLMKCEKLSEYARNKVHLPTGKQITKELKCMVRFFPDFHGFQEISSGKVLGIGREDDGLYILKACKENSGGDSRSRQKCCSSNSVNISSSVSNNGVRDIAMYDTVAQNSMLILKDFLALVKTQFDTIFKCLRTDNGIEFLMSKLVHYLENLDYFIRVLGHCAATAVYILNRLPSMVLNGVKKGDKFGPRAIPSVHIGYFSSQKGYILFDLTTKEFFVNRDTVFKENVFPFRNLLTEPSSIFPVLSFFEYDASSPSSHPQVSVTPFTHQNTTPSPSPQT
ncbi:uncharacterized protein LOC132038490 [Lycium ferocissimum]|uniref:uncharacterized protein LOC132038490 n=1 Tax=Lycium ferocissimum TaxID=112874 RepID=UPI0028166504|nr:uncharacterized protein LOC132038490 [Lycium ferocissimum]